MSIHRICIRSFLALPTREILGYWVQGSLSINFSLLSCQNKEFGNTYFYFFIINKLLCKRQEDFEPT